MATKRIYHHVNDSDNDNMEEDTSDASISIASSDSGDDIFQQQRQEEEEEEQELEEEREQDENHDSEEKDGKIEFREEMESLTENDENDENDEEEKLRRILQQQMTAEENSMGKAKEFTQQEMRTLEETDNLFSSSLFRLAFAEVLKEVGVNWEKQKGIEHALHALKKCLEEVSSERHVIAHLLDELPKESFAELHKMAARAKKSDDDNVVVVVESENKSKKKTKNKKKNSKKKNASLSGESITIQPPTLVSLVGSYLLRSVTKPNENVDVAISMPVFDDDPSSVGSLDAYYVKRAAYLCGIAQMLRQFAMFSKVQFEPFREDSLKPVLIIYPRKDASLAPKFKKTNFFIRVIPALPEEMDIPNNALTNPLYHGIMEDQFFLRHLHMLHDQMKTCPAMVESIVLLKVWARKRGILNRFDSVNGFLFSVLLLHLLHIGKVNRHMSPFQIMKITMFWIANGSSLTHGVSLAAGPRRGGSAVDEDTQEAIQDAKSHFDIVMLDDENRFNIFHRVSKMAWREVVHEAKLTLFYFNGDHRSEVIEALFLKKHNLYHKFDVYMRIDNISKINLSEDVKGHTKQFGTFVSHKIASSTRIAQLLDRALTDRIRFLRILPVQNSARSNIDSIVVGMILREQWDHLMTLGPQAQDIEAKNEFEEFWGEQAKIQTFKDGRIIVGAVWEKPQDSISRISVIENIVRFVLHRHLSLRMSNVRVICRDLHSHLHISNQDANRMRHALDDALSTVKRQLQAVSRGQLSIVKVQSISPEYSNTAVYPPVVNTLRSTMCPKYPFLNNSHAQPVHVVAEHASSSKWPDGLEAIDKLKQMFYMQYAQRMQLKTTATRHWLDVLNNGITFRIVIRLQKELQVMKRTGLVLSSKAIEVEQQLFQRATHCLWINSFSQRFRPYSGTVRLAKRWIHAHMFSEHISDVLIELICAHVFLSPHPYATPQLAVAGFGRFIDILANFSWSDTPMIVDFALPDDNDDDDDDDDDENDNDDDDKKKSSTRLRKQQYKSAPMDKVLESIVHEYESMDEKPHIFVVASYNKHLKNYWTQRSPSRMILRRMASYARQAEAQLRNFFGNQFQTDSQDCKVLFTTTLVSYDLIIHIKPSLLLHPERTIHVQHEIDAQENDGFKKQSGTFAGINPVVNLMANLRNRFGHLGLFFMDGMAGGDCIAVAWNPAIFLPQRFNMTQTTATIPLEGSIEGYEENRTHTIPNIFEIMSDMRRMGEDIIDRIEIVDHSQKVVNGE